MFFRLFCFAQNIFKNFSFFLLSLFMITSFSLDKYGQVIEFLLFNISS